LTEEVNDKLVISLVGSLGDPAQGDPQISLHTSYDRDADPAGVQAGMDKIAAAFARQRNIAEIGRVEKHIRECRKMLANLGYGDEDREAAYQRQADHIRTQIGVIKAKVPGILDVDREEWNKAGRAGPYKQSNAVTTRINGLNREVEKLTIDLTNLGLERDANIKNQAETAKSWHRQIAEDEAEIARLKALIE
jgi:hypothetical protein